MSTYYMLSTLLSAVNKRDSFYPHGTYILAGEVDSHPWESEISNMKKNM